MRKLFSSIPLVLLASLSLATSASAADTWYAANDGSGTECTQLAPCEAHYAVETKPAEGDTVVFAGGDYNISSWLQVDQGVSIEGSTTGTPTRLIGGAGAYTTLWVTAGPVGTGHHVTDLTISATEVGGNALYVGDGSTDGVVIDRVHATSTGTSGVGIYMQKQVGTEPMIVRNSVGRVTGNTGIGIMAKGPMGSAGNMEMHNVVADATAADGIAAAFDGGGMPMMMCGNITGVFKNSIAHAATPENDLRVQPGTGMAPCTAHVNSTNSVWRASSGGGTTASVGDLPALVPLFEDAAAGDFHPLAGSPVVNAGANDAMAGTMDLDRNARVSGTAIDIGPYETYEDPPPVVTPPVVTPAVDTTPPTVSALKFTPTAFLPKPVATQAAAAAKKKPKGSTISFNSTEGATLTFTTSIRVTGRKTGSSCSPKARRGKKCTTYKALRGSFSLAAKPGANSFKFSGYVNGKPLKAGAYRLTGVAKDAAGNAGAAVTARFRILKR